MPQFRLIHPDENATPEDVLSVVQGFNSAVKILDGGIAAIEVQMTESQAADFILFNANWACHSIRYPQDHSPLNRQMGPR